MKNRKSLLYIILLSLFTISADAHWTTRGPFGGTVTCFHVNDTLIYAGTADGGVYRTTNSAATTWRYANYTGLTSPHITSITSIGTKILCATSDAGVFVSSDQGTTWTASNTGITDMNVQVLTTSGSMIIAGTQAAGVFISNDSGATWNNMSNGITNLNITALASQSNFHFAGTAGGGVFVSIDSGISWAPANTGLTDSTITTLAADSTAVYAGTPSGIFKANSTGGSWAAFNSGLNNLYINDVALHGGYIYAATFDGVYSSTASTLSWSASNNGYQDTVYAVTGFNNQLFAGSEYDGIYKSITVNPSPVSWSEMNNGFNNMKGHTVYNDGLLVIAATDHGVFVSRDLATNYMHANNGLNDSLHVVSLAFGGPDLLAATSNGGVYMSADTGGFWTQENIGLSNTALVSIAATPDYAFIADNAGNVYSASLSITAISWMAAIGLPSPTQVTDLHTEGTLVFAGTNDGVFLSTDNGISFSAFNTGLPSLNVTALTSHNGFMYASVSGSGIYKSPASAAAWLPCNSGLPTTEIQAMFSSAQWVLAGFKGGVYSSFDEGASWLPAGVSLYIPSYTDINAISFSTASPRVFIATPSNSFYSNSISELPVGINELDKLPVLSVFPNPGNGLFYINANDLSSAIRVVTVHAFDGKLSDVDYRPGLPLDLRHLPAGIYMVNIQTANESRVARVCILRQE